MIAVSVVNEWTSRVRISAEIGIYIFVITPRLSLGVKQRSIQWLTVLFPRWQRDWSVNMTTQIYCRRQQLYEGVKLLCIPQYAFITWCLDTNILSSLGRSS